jgi:hypothetical protein
MGGIRDPGLFYRQPPIMSAEAATAKYLRRIKEAFPSVAHLPDALLAYQSLD